MCKLLKFEEKPDKHLDDLVGIELTVLEKTHQKTHRVAVAAAVGVLGRINDSEEPAESLRRTVKVLRRVHPPSTSEHQVYSVL